jgi:protein-L-isoaspartate(D-aspartate) O-methyltransferase
MSYADEAYIAPLASSYVQALKSAGIIRSPRLERAFLTVRRHRLLETYSYFGDQGRVTVRHDPEHPAPENLEVIYADTALATRHVGGMPASSSSAPSLMAEMLELLDLRQGMKVLEIGAGTGYNAALMAEIVGDQRLIVTVDNQRDVVEQTRRLLGKSGYGGIRIMARDGFAGAAEDGPFDRIVATVGCSDLSPRWAEQLADGGVMLIPLQHAESHPLAAVRNQDGELRGRFVGWSGFMPVRGPLYIEDMWSRGVVIPADRAAFLPGGRHAGARHGLRTSVPPASGPSSSVPPASGPSSSVPPASGPSSSVPPASGPSSSVACSWPRVSKPDSESWGLGAIPSSFGVIGPSLHHRPPRRTAPGGKQQRRDKHHGPFGTKKSKEADLGTFLGHPGGT